MRILALLTLPTVALLALSGCALVPRGPVVSESRDIDLASAVVLETSGDVTIRQGDPSLVVSAPRAVLERLTTAVDDEGTLVLGVTPGTPGLLLGRVSYELTLPRLDALTITGSGDIDSDAPTGDDLLLEITGSGDLDLEQIDAAEVELAIVGSGDVELTGRSDTLTIRISGSGDVRSEGLDTARVTVEIDGSGDVSVAATETLDVAISGAGDVEYVGRPEVTQQIAGVGSVDRR